MAVLGALLVPEVVALLVHTQHGILGCIFTHISNIINANVL